MSRPPARPTMTLTMNGKNLIAVLAAMAAVSGAVVAWQSHRAARALYAEARAADEERERLAALVRTQEKQIAEAKRQQIEVGSKQVAGAVPAKTAARPDLGVTANARLNPELQARALETYKAGLSSKYGAFYRTARLGTEQVAKFEAQLTEHEGRIRDIRAAEVGLPINLATAETREAIATDGRKVQVMVDPSIAKLQREEDARLKSEQTALLGEAGYAQWQDFERSGDSRAFVTQLVKNLALTTEPLSATQGEQLVHDLQARGFSAALGAPEIAWAAVLAEEQGSLTPGQLAELQAQIAKSKEGTERAQLERLVGDWRKGRRDQGR